MRYALEVAAGGLFPLDGLEERLEVALAEALGAFALDDFVEEGGPVLDRLAEDLQEIALVVAVDENAELAQRLQVFVDLADALEHGVVVIVRDVEELDAGGLQAGHRTNDVIARECQV